MLNLARVPYWLPNLLAGLAIFYLALLIWRRHRFVRGGLSFSWLCLAAAWWALCEALLFIDSGFENKVVITKLQYLGIVSCPPLIYYFSRLYTTGQAPMGRGALLTHATVATAMLAMVWTNEFHHLIFLRLGLEEGGPFPMISTLHGPAFWVWLVYAYWLLLLTAAHMLRFYLGAAGLLKKHALIILVTLLAPWATNAIYLLNLWPVPNMDPTPVSFALITASLYWGLFRLHLMDVVPVAKEEVFISLSDPVMVLDQQDRCLDLNPAAQKLFGRQAGECVGMPADEILAHLPGPRALLGQSGPRRQELEIMRRGLASHFDVSLSELKSAQGQRLGRLMVLRDITSRIQLENQLRLLAETDPLTGLNNRRRFFELGEREVERARRYGHPWACSCSISTISSG